jgi:excisionase family DNA binding protein
MVYTVEEVANILKISTATVRKLIKQGRLVAFSVGGQMRIRKEDLDRFMGGR